MTLPSSHRVLALQRLELVLEAAAGRQADDRRQVEGDDVGGADLLRRRRTSARISACAEVGRRRVRSSNGFSLATMKAVLDSSAPSSSEKPIDRNTSCDLRHALQHAPRPAPSSSLVRATEAPSGSWTLRKNAPWSSSRQEAGRRASSRRPKMPPPTAPPASSEIERHRISRRTDARHSRRAPGRCRAARADDRPARRDRAQEHSAERRRQRQRVDRRDQHGRR